MWSRDQIAYRMLLAAMVACTFDVIIRAWRGY